MANANGFACINLHTDPMNVKPFPSFVTVIADRGTTFPAGLKITDVTVADKQNTPHILFKVTKVTPSDNRLKIRFEAPAGYGLRGLLPPVGGGSLSITISGGPQVNDTPVDYVDDDYS